MMKSGERLAMCGDAGKTDALSLTKTCCWRLGWEIGAKHARLLWTGGTSGSVAETALWLMARKVIGGTRISCIGILPGIGGGVGGTETKMDGGITTLGGGWTMVAGGIAINGVVNADTVTIPTTRSNKV